MAKAQGFAAKMAKAQKTNANECPTCGESIAYLLNVNSEKSDKAGSWKFNQKMVGVCKCNEQEIYG